MGQMPGASPRGGAKYVKYSVRFCAKSGSSRTSCSPWAATALTGGTPARGAEMDPSGRTMRMLPEFSVTRKLPSGRKEIDHAPLKPVAMVCTLTGGEALAGGGASVWPANAGFGFWTWAYALMASVARQIIVLTLIM